MSKGLGVNQKKVLLLLQAGLALGLTPSPRAHFYILKELAKEWKEINRSSLRKAIKSLYESKMIDMKYNKEKDAITVVLSEDGKEKALTYEIDEMKIKEPKIWDKKWRIVLFDIPELHRKSRDALRYRLRQLGFYEYQKSVFVHPYDCKNEIEYIIEFYRIRKFVRFIIADSLDNELHLKKDFDLL